MESPIQALVNGQLETRWSSSPLSVARASDTGGSQNGSTEPLLTDPSEPPSNSKIV